MPYIWNLNKLNQNIKVGANSYPWMLFLTYFYQSIYCQIIYKLFAVLLLRPRNMFYIFFEETLINNLIKLLPLKVEFYIKTLIMFY